MLESKSDYLHSLNRKLSSGLLHNSQTHELNGFSNPQISLYSPLHKTDSLREIAATSKGYLRGDTRNLNDSFSDKSSKGTVLNVSQLDNVDHDRFFENFDKIFKVHQASTDASPGIEEAMKKKNICRVLLDDFELDRSIAYMNDVFHPERSLNGLVNKEKALPKLEHIPSKTYLKTEPSMSEMVPYKLTDYRDISKEPVVDRVRFEFPTKAGKDKLPDLKVPKMVVNRLNTMTVEAPAPLKAHESKPYKFQDNNAKLIGKVRVNVPVQQTVTNNADMASVRNNKNSQQALEKIVKPKKLGNLTKSKTFVLEGVKDTKGQGQSDDMRVRVNSLQGIENGPKSTGAGQKNDLSLDLGGGTKSKFFLKGLEQKTSNAGNGQGIVNKTQNELKNTRNNVTSRTYYSKENLSFLSNSNRDKALEGNHLKGIKESHNVAGRVIEASNQAPSNFHGQTVKMGAEEITKIYKELRQSLKLTESQKLAQNGRIASNSLKPINDGNNEHVPQR